MIVVDTNVFAYLLLNVPESADAEAVRQRDSDWVAPFILRSELRNVLQGQVRHNRITRATAFELMEEAEDMLTGHELWVSSQDVLRLAFASGVSAYDCEFVALAKDLGLRLVTADKQVLAKFPETAVSLASFAEGS